MVKVKLLGELGRRFGREFELNITTPAEAIRAIGYQVDGFFAHLEQSRQAGVDYRVVTNNPIGLEAEQCLEYIPSGLVVIAPQISGRGGFGRILAGVALVAIALAVPAATFGLTSMTTIGLVGAGLILNGFSQLLAPKAKSSNNNSERDNSFLIDRAANVGDQGQPIPVWIGERYITGLVVLSSALYVNEYNASLPIQLGVSSGASS